MARIAKKLRLDASSGIQWRAAADVPLIDISGKKKNPQKGRNHSWFGKEEKIELFKKRKWGSSKIGQMDRSRQLIAAQSVLSQSGGGGDTIQHDAPLPLGFLSAYAGGCAARCNDPTKFTYGSDGDGVMVYIVDGVRSLMSLFFCEFFATAVFLEATCRPSIVPLLLFRCKTFYAVPCLAQALIKE